MKHTRACLFFMSVVIVSMIGAVADSAAQTPCTVLVVMSYAEEFFWNVEVREGIETVLGERCDLHYAYLDKISHPDGIAAKAEEAYSMYQTVQPDGVIAADDDAQTAFVLPYLKDQVDIPIMFCGVNATPEQYGFPTENISGILQRPHIRESITFVRQLVPDIKTVGCLSLDFPPGQGLAQQVKQEEATYPVEMLDVQFVTTLEGALEAVDALKSQCDALFMGPLGALSDADGNCLADADVYPVLAEAFGKPTFTLWAQVVPYGVLCAVADRGQEQGELAAEMLWQAVQGTPVTDLPITQNKQGKLVLNVTVMKALGIRPKAHMLKGVKVVETLQ